jgi:acetylornithine deacetylase
MSEADFAIQPQRLRNLLRRLIDIYSPSGKEEEVVDYLYGYLKRHGLPVVRQEVDDDRHNLVVMPSHGDIHLALIGHLDTVTAYDLEDYGFDEDGDRVVGLGAADMKGGCAAMVEAFLTLWETRGATAGGGKVALALVAGEEQDGDGAQRLVKEYHFPWAIIGEPTDLKPCLSHYGYLEMHVTTRGRRMHASLANQGENPIKAMLHLLLKISNYLETCRPEAVYNIRELSSSQAGFVVPDRCEAWLDNHLPPTAPIGEIMLEMEELLLQERQSNPQLDAALRFATIHAGYELPEKGPLVEALRTLYGRLALPWEPLPFRSHSDANLLWAAGVKPILIGPGQLEQAHAPGESVSFQQVCHAALLYYDVLSEVVGHPEKWV